MLRFCGGMGLSRIGFGLECNPLGMHCVEQALGYGKAHMTKTQRKKFRGLLEAKQAELVGQLTDRREHLVIDQKADPIDRVLGLTDRELTIRKIDLTSALLRKVRAALREIDDGTFGQCVSCEREIPLKRLEAVPWSLYCVACQETLEANAKDAMDDPAEPQYLTAG